MNLVWIWGVGIPRKKKISLSACCEIHRSTGRQGNAGKLWHAYVKIFPPQPIIIITLMLLLLLLQHHGLPDPLPHQILPIMFWLGGRVETSKSGAQRLDHEIGGPLLLPCGAVDERIGNGIEVAGHLFFSLGRGSWYGEAGTLPAGKLWARYGV